MRAALWAFERKPGYYSMADVLGPEGLLDPLRPGEEHAKRLLRFCGSLWDLSGASAQSYPDRAIKVIVPYPAGGPTDTVARAVTQSLSAELGQSVVIENQSGAGGRIAMKAVARGTPDGYTLLLGGTNNNAITPALYKDLDFDAVKDFAPVAAIATNSLVLVVHPSVPAKTLAELVAYAKANPGKLSSGGGVGISPHFLLEFVRVKSGANILFVPYRGAAPAMTDVIAGQIQMHASAKTLLLPQIQAGKLRALAVASATRWPELPDVPTLREAGLEGFPTAVWYGLLAPAGTPAPVVGKLNAAVNARLKSDAVTAAFAKLGLEAKSLSPQDFGAVLVKERELWAALAQQTGIKLAPEWGYFRSSDMPVISGALANPSVRAESARGRRGGLPRQRRAPRAMQQQRHRIGGVRGVRAAGERVEHQLAVAVVGGDDQRAASSRARRQYGRARVDRFHRLDRGRQTAGVADHVGVGVVEDDQVVFAGADRRDHLVGQLRRRHLGLQVVGRDLGRGHHDAVLAGIRLLAPAVEEKGDVRVLLGLRDAQLRAAGVGDDLAQDVRAALRREDRRHQLVERVGVLRHADRGGECDHARAREAVEFRIEHRGQNFARPVGAEVEEQQPSPSRMPR